MTIEDPELPAISRYSPRFFPGRTARQRLTWGVLVIATILAAANGARAAWAAVHPTTDAAALAPALRLAAGTIQLDHTSQAVDTGTATRLLPLWRVLAQLSNTAAASPEEITAVVDQIQLNMSPAQIKAVETMRLPSVDHAAPSSSTETPAIIQQVIDLLQSKAQS
jgi:hypothetical protein